MPFLLIAAVPAVANAAPTEFAPVDRLGPALSVLLPATAVNSAENYSWNWKRALTKAEAIVMDALNHPSPAQLSAVAVATATRVPAEPPLRCYVYAGACP